MTAKNAPLDAGWMLLAEGTPLQPGDGFLHPNYHDYWIDFECRPDLFRGNRALGLPRKDFSHTWPWRRKILNPETAK